jgi:D-beta-D-heptose 7-phosphate kinase/D-beta-D-heptose 1-phosphate adenosyltransferase
MTTKLPLPRVRQLLSAFNRARVTVLGDVMLDQFLWGSVARLSPEAPVPVVEFERESFIPGGAGNVARNLAHLRANAELLSVTGDDAAARQLRQLLSDDGVACSNLLACVNRVTSVKTRIVAERQHVVRVDRESRGDIEAKTADRLLAALAQSLQHADALILGDYAKGVISQPLLDQMRRMCRARGVWLSMDPKPAHSLNLAGLSLLTPNRREAFALAALPDESHRAEPSQDAALHRVADKLLAELQPALLLITLGEHGMLLCQRGQKPFHVPTAAREVFDVSGAGDTVIASFTLAIVAGASPVEAAYFSNYAAGIVVGKLGTATVTPDEMLAAFRAQP